VAVEKLHFPPNGRNLGDRKCLGKTRTEIQSSGRERSAELMLEDQRLMDGLQQKASAKSGTEQAASEQARSPQIY
jgi:hypothetical protein